ncbi:hypothetical protein N657DRAFT_29312 [Parathielavia appendiculata]|uniref:Uncharacterized protein n=1 Tax=Parathielavia appendiculata TaxID=2587402 RepID=A0AAN6Z7F7_9PEZI|nr:hypothetical protein N657DRAFT_29312 [Parathielavia appendiculata]
MSPLRCLCIRCSTFSIHASGTANVGLRYPSCTSTYTVGNPGIIKHQTDPMRRGTLHLMSLYPRSDRPSYRAGCTTHLPDALQLRRLGCLSPCLHNPEPTTAVAVRAESASSRDSLPRSELASKPGSQSHNAFDLSKVAPAVILRRALAALFQSKSRASEEPASDQAASHLEGHWSNVPVSFQVGRLIGC